jgi:Gram-negative bacterial TonB protein C-terminal
MRSFGFPTLSASRTSRLFAVVLALTLCSALTYAQKTAGNAASASSPAAASLEWETLRPEGETFSVLMPKGSSFEASREPYHKMELSTRTYLSSRPTGPVFAVVSLSGIKSNPAMYTDMQRTNSYVDAFKNLFAPRVRKDAVAKLTLVGEKALLGNAGREYRLTIADLAGTAQVFATKKRFYALVYLNSAKDDALQEQFLSSFTLPEHAEPPVTAQAAEAAPAVNAQSDASASKPQPNESAATKQADPTHTAAGTEPGKRRPISGGVLNGKAISLPKPDYPVDAKAAGIEGVVVVQVTVDEQGIVVEARPVSGPVPLQQPSASAALLARFSPTLLMGEPVKVTGVIVYTFGQPQN